MYTNYNKFKLNELINSREELIDVKKSEIEKYIEPALLTKDEYLKIINSKNEWHGDDAYNFSLSNGKASWYDIYKIIDNSELINQKNIGKVNIKFYVKKEKTRFGYYENPNAEDYNDKNWINYTEQEKKDKGLPIYNYEVYALHEDESIIVGAAHDEWGCVLIWTLDEYRGMGIGEEIIKIYRKYYPSKPSGGFTSFGYNQILKYHAHLVRKYLQNGIYSDMIKKGEITGERAKEIVNSIKDIKRFNSGKNSSNPLAKYYGDTTTNIYLGDNYVVIYDNKLLKKNELSLDSSLDELVYGNTIKAYISVKGLDNDFYSILMMYSVNKQYFEIAFKFISSMFPDGISNKYFIHDKDKHGIKELNWIEELVKKGEYEKEIYEKYKDIEYYNIYKIKNPIKDIEEIKELSQKQLKMIDPYEEGFNIMIEKAEGVWYDYYEENISDYYYNVAINKLKEYAEDSPESFKENVTRYQFRLYFISYFGENNWDELSGGKQSIIMNKAEKEYEKILKSINE